MFGVTTSDDYQPVTYVGRYPVDVTTILVAVHSIAAIIACFLTAAGGAILARLIFDSSRVLGSGAFWQIASYAFVHFPSSLLWFVVEMYMLFAFGREVERFIGRRSFIILYLVLLVAPTLLLTLAGGLMRTELHGSGLLHLGIFVAFATIYPSVEMMMLRVPMKWIAMVLVAIGMLVALSARDWSSIIALGATAAIAFVFIRSRGVGSEMEWWTNLKARFQPKPKFQVVPRTSPRRTVEPEDVYDSIDPLLEKISKHGINSLTASERRALDRARNQLLKKSP
ncbi:MAG: rhomboid family intramembrane serine protease [Verrucomicrobiota bacterium]|nr:rhomboid family intramembrane serine protease [Verrucomicrobiota bacterium]